MTDAPDPLRFQISRGEIKLPEWVEAARTAMKGLSPLAAARAVVSPSFWVAAAKGTVDLIGQLVDVPLADVLVTAWKTHRRFREFTDPRLYPPGTSTTVPIATHHLTATQEPYIEIFIDGDSKGKIRFELKLDLTVEAGALVIRNGRFMRLEGGQGKVTGTLKCADVVVAERASREFKWSDGISFGEGIPIGVAG